MSFILKILQKLLGRYIRYVALANRSLHQDQYAYRIGVSSENALSWTTEKVDFAFEIKQILLCAFLDIDDAFDNTSLDVDRLHS